MDTQDAPEADAPEAEPAEAVPAAPAPVAEPVRRLRFPGQTGRWVAPLYLALAVLMLPWVVLLAIQLPDRILTSNYRLAWVGFDCLLLVAMARTAWLAARASPFVVNVASATAALLIVDAWFDLTTSPPGRERLYAVLAAGLLELPAAALSLWIAVRAQRVIATTGAMP